MKRKWVILAAAAVILLAAGFYVYTTISASRQAKADFSSLEFGVVEQGALVTTIDATGKVRSAQTAVLKWGASGTVEQVTVLPGQQVRAGEKLATLLAASLPQSVISAQADLETARQNLEDLYPSAETSKTEAMKRIAQYADEVRDAQYQLDNYLVPTSQQGMDAMTALAEMEKRLNEARAAFEPYKMDILQSTTRENLKEALDLAQSNYDAAVKRVAYEYDLAVARANLSKAQHDYDTWKDGPSPADLAAAQAKVTAAEADLRLQWIEAPFAGTITAALPQPGDQVTAAQEAFRLDNLETLYVDLDVSEVDVNLVEAGQPVMISFDAISGKEYQGEVTEVAMISSESSGAVNFIVTVKLLERDPDVRPGMTSAVEIVIEHKEQTLLVPSQAIRLENGVQVVYKLISGQGLTPVEIQVGSSSESMTQVLGGELKAGDQIVLNPASAANKTGLQRPPRGLMERVHPPDGNSP